MALAMQERQRVGREVSLRYLRSQKKEKGIMLQEFCTTTRYSPPYAAYLLRTYAPRECGPSPHKTISMAQTAEACVQPCRGGGARLGVPPCRGALWQETAGSDTGAPACVLPHLLSTPNCIVASRINLLQSR